METTIQLSMINQLLIKTNKSIMISFINSGLSIIHPTNSSNRKWEILSWMVDIIPLTWLVNLLSLVWILSTTIRTLLNNGLVQLFNNSKDGLSRNFKEIEVLSWLITFMPEQDLSMIQLNHLRSFGTRSSMIGTLIWWILISPKLYLRLLVMITFKILESFIEQPKVRLEISLLLQELAQIMDSFRLLTPSKLILLPWNHTIWSKLQLISLQHMVNQPFQLFHTILTTSISMVSLIWLHNLLLRLSKQWKLAALITWRTTSQTSLVSCTPIQNFLNLASPLLILSVSLMKLEPQQKCSFVKPCMAKHKQRNQTAWKLYHKLFEKLIQLKIWT